LIKGHIKSHVSLRNDIPYLLSTPYRRAPFNITVERYIKHMSHSWSTRLLRYVI